MAFGYDFIHFIMATISKSRFVSGTQCQKKLYFDVFRKELKPKVSEQQQALFDTGHLLGKLAQEVFPGGMDVTDGMNGDWAIAIQRTVNSIQQGVSTIYEATFSINGGFAALDILHHSNGERWAIEVKGSNSVKDYHITDASFQYYVMSMAGYKPDRFYLMHLNKAFVKQGDIDPVKLFKLQDITDDVLRNQAFVIEKHAELLQMLEAGNEPVKDIGKHCSSPFSCEYMHHCWSHLPDDNVFNLSYASGKDWELYENDVFSLVEIPDDFKLSHRQQIQVNGVKKNESYIDLTKIKEFIGRITEPVHFFDFETILTPIPILDGTTPFQQVPFQYSLHISELSGSILEHREFLADPDRFTNKEGYDPRLQLIQQMERDICPKGSILSYNAKFEIAVLRRLATDYPAYRGFIEDMISRIVDLLVPFSRGWYYTPEMGASASIKSVLPALAPEFSYRDLEIGNGMMTSNIFLSMAAGNFTGDKVKTMNDMLAYCKRDSEGMVVIYRHLKGIMS
jgi:hypothetical protein